MHAADAAGTRPRGRELLALDEISTHWRLGWSDLDPPAHRGRGLAGVLETRHDKRRSGTKRTTALRVLILGSLQNWGVPHGKWQVVVWCR